ncbi:class I SAM-dependent methyltransferase [Kutzneria sp. 744]|uniref:class I SAM-dependent methyltransferase n=1 Tax=Kutzneria sp. (strain 744) TaxID=345341 RepID=UPI0003EECBE2|nr:class I SAM-dependent methyltransferase [Kutzneria sp. 744]EWM19816.1 methyltransferase [Kutzneria sp. 744]
MDSRGYGTTFHHRREGEWRRLVALADVMDPYSRTRLQTLPVPQHPAILEVGPGAGAMARWMADAFQPAELVVLDCDRDLLGRIGSAAIRTVHADLTDAMLAQPGQFDLIHVRNVLAHLPDPQVALDQLVSWLRPGGWLVLSDITDSASLTSDPWALAVARVIREGLNTHVGSHLDWAPGFPQPLRRAGLEDVHVAIDVPPLVAGGPAQQFLSMTAQALSSTGFAEVGEPGPELLTVSPMAMVSAWGCAPHARSARS